MDVYTYVQEWPRMGLVALEMPEAARHFLEKVNWQGRCHLVHGTDYRPLPAPSGAQDWVTGDSGRGVGRGRLL